jgi:type IV pilus assembly protein PilM
LAEYETAVRAAGYEPGAVLSSSLAALAGVDSLQAVLVANISPLALTTSISNGQDLLLYRTLDLPENPVIRLEEVRRGVAVAAAYYEDKLGTPPAQLYFAGNTGFHESGSEAFARWIDFPDLAVLDLNTRPATGALRSVALASIAGVTGALAGVR